MKTIKKALVIGLLLWSSQIWGQTANPRYIGDYKDMYGTLTELSLNEDGTFKLKTPDPVFPYTHKDYENIGNWISKGDTVFLNPDREPKERTIELVEKQIGTTDSITIKINYLVDYYDDGLFLERQKFDFDMFSVCINKKKKHFHISHHPQLRTCLFAPKVKNQVIVDSSNIFKIPAQKVSRIGVFTYGFDAVEWLDISNASTDFIEMTIIQPVDKNRMPENRAIIMKKDKAYFYQRNGKIEKSYYSALVRQK